MDDSMISLGMVLALIFIAVIAIVIFFQFIPFGLWLTALFSGVRVSFFTLFGMRFRRVDPRAIVLPLISGHKAGIQLNVNDLEGHYLAGGEREPGGERPDLRRQGRHRPHLQAGHGDRPGGPRRVRGGAGQRQSEGHHHAQGRRDGQGRHPAPRAGPGDGAGQHQPAGGRRGRGDDPRARGRRHREHHRLGCVAQGGAGESRPHLEDGARQGSRRGNRVRDSLDRHRRRGRGQEHRRRAADRPGRGRQADRAGQGRGAPGAGRGDGAGVQGRGPEAARRGDRRGGPDPAGDGRGLPERQPRRHGLPALSQLQADTTMRQSIAGQSDSLPSAGS